ncbi:MAG: TIGR02281 family clan AA aspartic protease [Brevundimonas sp.]|jgi:aspartyl protease family protein|uniref:retropepsin-like aspartic protease family protein n=1 Tax=Brevundimonas sp. TaxID=1871086 RepID=UPI00391C54F0
MYEFGFRSGGVIAMATAAALGAYYLLDGSYPRDASVARAADGHYWAVAEVNGAPVRFLVDTGSSMVALTRHDAARLGLEPAPEDFRREVLTASGPARAAPVELSHVSVDGARVERVEALVFEDGLHASLLGMSYLGRLSRIEATPSAITLRR